MLIVGVGTSEPISSAQAIRLSSDKPASVRNAVTVLPRAYGQMTIPSIVSGDEIERKKLADAAGQWHRENTGAVARTLAVIREELAKVPGGR